MRKSSLSLLLSLAFLLSLALLLPLARADQELLDAVNVGDIAHVRRHLEELGKDPNHHDPWEKSVLIHASYNGHADIVELLIEKGADVNARSKHSGRTPLIAAAYHGNVEALAVLLAHGADVNVQDKRHKYTALHHAINEIRNDHDAKHEECIRELIEAGADPHLIATNGRTAEHMMDMKKLHHKHLHKHVLKHVEKTRPSSDEL